MTWKKKCVEYSLGSNNILGTDHNDEIIPTDQDMKYIIDENVNPMLEYMIGHDNGKIIKITNNIIEFKVKHSVLEMYGEDVLEDVDDDGNYPITRNGRLYLFYARNVKCLKKHKSSKKSTKRKSFKKSTKRKSTQRK